LSRNEILRLAKKQLQIQRDGQKRLGQLELCQEGGKSPVFVAIVSNILKIIKNDEV
jgi:hypothetical protein